MVIETVGEGVKAYRDDAWTIIFNQALELMETKEDDAALKKLNLCIKMNHLRPEAYAALVQYYVNKGDFKTAKEYAKYGEVLDSPVLYEMNAKLLLQEFQNTKKNDLLIQAEEMYLKAMDLVDDAT